MRTTPRASRPRPINPQVAGSGTVDCSPPTPSAPTAPVLPVVPLRMSDAKKMPLLLASKSATERPLARLATNSSGGETGSLAPEPQHAIAEWPKWGIVGDGRKILGEIAIKSGQRYRSAADVERKSVVIAGLDKLVQRTDSYLY